MTIALATPGSCTGGDPPAAAARLRKNCGDDPDSGGTTAVDRLLLWFIAALAVVTALSVRAPGVLLGSLAAMAASIATLARFQGRSRVLRIAHGFVAVPVLAALVNAVGPAIGSVNPGRYDRALAAIDARWLGPVARAWTFALGRPDWLTDLAAIAYLSYYVLPIAFAAALWKAGRRAEFDRLVFALTAILLASYAAYFLAPAAGPRFSPQALSGGGAPSAALRAFLHACERNELDAFPSGHTATSLIFLSQAWVTFRRLRGLLLAAVAAIVFSTVYLSLHYVIDVVAGAALAAVVATALRRRAALLVERERWTALPAG